MRTTHGVFTQGVNNTPEQREVPGVELTVRVRTLLYLIMEAAGPGKNSLSLALP